MRTGVIVGVPQFVVQFSFTEFKVLFDCARNHYSSDVRHLLDRAGEGGRTNGLITQMENWFSHMANSTTLEPCVMNLSFREIDLFLKTMETQQSSCERWREREFLAALEINSLFKTLLESANRLNWKQAVHIGIDTL